MWKLMENVASKIVEICSLIIDCRKIRECSFGCQHLLRVAWNVNFKGVTGIYKDRGGCG